MTVKECYEAMGGDYEDVLKRLMSEARVQKFALMFKKDPSMSQLTQAMDAGDMEKAKVMWPGVQACYERVENALNQLEQ